MSERILLEILILLLGTLLLLIGFIWRSHAKQHEQIMEKLEEVTGQRIACVQEFATKEAVRRAHSRLDDLHTRVTRLEEQA